MTGDGMRPLCSIVATRSSAATSSARAMASRATASTSSSDAPVRAARGGLEDDQRLGRRGRAGVEDAYGLRRELGRPDRVREHRRELGGRREHDDAVVVTVVDRVHVVEDRRRAGLHLLVAPQRVEHEAGVDALVGELTVGEQDRDRDDPDPEVGAAPRRGVRRSSRSRRACGPSRGPPRPQTCRATPPGSATAFVHERASLW